ncbi:HIT domain-containing protein [Candidatus Dependentiae bacterium]|nr:HIT domain-containing protein [Candidatus Dependentiae bacterium]
MMNTDCIFCTIIEGRLPVALIAESETVIVIKDKYPKASIHYLIIPKSHYRTLQDLDDHAVLGDLLQMARSLAESDPTLSDFKLLLNNGYLAGQRVFHVHMHFLAGSEKINLENII